MAAHLNVDSTADAIVVLGCRVETDGSLSDAAQRRCHAAANGFRRGVAPLIIASGGRLWGDQVEALCLREELVRQGVPSAAIWVELCSLTTAENAVYSAALLRRACNSGSGTAAIATSSWHLDRALLNFGIVGVRAFGLPANDPAPTLMERLRRSAHELASTRLDIAMLARAGARGRSFLPSFLAIAVLATVLSACGPRGDKGGADSGPYASSSSTAAAPSGSSEDRLRRLEAAEQGRSVSTITTDDQSNRDPNVRRAAARALARIATPAARAGLLRALSDEDPDVVSWAAYGLGATCEVAPDETVSALAARSLDLPEASKPVEAPPSNGAAHPPPLDPFATIARAVGRCNAPTSEATLAAWLGAERKRASSAALALGDLASAQKRLREETIATLLTLAAGSASTPAVPEALFPISRIENVPPSVVARLLDVASARLAEKSDYRLFAVRALSRAKEGALPHLERVLLGKDSFTPSERIEAARSLARLGPDGTLTLSAALKKLIPEPKSVAAGGEGFDVPMTIVLSLKDAKDSKDTLTQIAALAAPDGASASARRRISTLRCAAAKLIADQNFKDPLLAICDLDKAGIGARALVDIVGKGVLEGPRLDAWKKLVDDPDVRAREGALDLIASHHEIPGAVSVLVRALGAKEAGIVGTAAEQISKTPIVASQRPDKKTKRDKTKPSDKPDKAAPKDPKDSSKGDEPAEPLGPPVPEIVAALGAALDRAEKEQDYETLASVVDAIGALSLKDKAPKLEELCKSTYPVARAHAATALGLFTGKKRACPAPDVAGPSPPELVLAGGGAPVLPQSTLVLDTDAGELRIHFDPAIAPIATLRFLDLAKSGYYDNDVIHRVDPSFVVQFGSPFGDGSGGPVDRQPLRCETSPLPFETLSVGVALAGRDTGSSQLFVMRARHPHLDGGYALVGTASGPWDLVSEGDVIHSAKLE